MELKFDLTAPLADDEHTASDGPYIRALKARKWLYTAAVLASLNHYRLLDYAAVNKLTAGLLSVADWMMTNALTVGLVVIWIQFCALLVQLRSAYWSILLTRLFKNSAEAIEREQERLHATSTQLHASADANRKLADTSKELSEKLDGLIEQHRHAQASDYTITESSTAPRSVSPSIERAQHLEGEITYLKRELESVSRQIKEHQQNMMRLTEAERTARLAYEDRVNSMPERRISYRVAEIIIDVLRVGAPFAVGTATLVLVLLAPRPEPRPLKTTPPTPSAHQGNAEKPSV